MTLIDRGAVATAALTALLVAVIGIGADEIKALLDERRAARKERAS